MKSIKRLWIISTMVSILLFACGGSEKKAEEADSPDSILESVKLTDIKKISGVETYVGDSLYEYIDGGAEVFHQYDFIKVSTADFSAGGIEVVADIYELANSDMAYGMYSILRPDGIETVEIGVQGFTSETSYDFVKGRYLIKLICYDGTPEAVEAMRKLAAGIEAVAPGTVEMPEQFAMFPIENQVAGSEKIIAESYLGQAYLDDVFTVDYAFDTETIQIFVTKDESGAKYTGWIENSDINADAMKSIKDLPFDSGKMMMLNDPYYGNVLAGLKNDKLAGVVGYSDYIKPFIAAWLMQ